MMNEIKKRTIAILGSTGSIGTQTLDVIRNNEDLELVALAAGSNIVLLETEAKESFKEELLNIDKYANRNELNVVYYKSNLEESLNSINRCNNINKVSIIFTKKIESAYEFIKNLLYDTISKYTFKLTDFGFQNLTIHIFNSNRKLL